MRTAPTKDVQVRGASNKDLSGLASVRVAAWHAAYRRIIPRADLRRITPQSSATLFEQVLQRRNRELLVAEREGEPVGYALVGPQTDRRLRFAGEIYELYVHPSHQRRGVGRELLTASIWRLVELGLNPVVVWVLVQNPARHFYEACGARQIARDDVSFGGFRTSRLAFGWESALPLPGLSFDFPGA